MTTACTSNIDRERYQFHAAPRPRDHPRRRSRREGRVKSAAAAPRPLAQPLPSTGVSAEARAMNRRYLDEMANADAASALGRVRDLWWQPFLAACSDSGIPSALDQADVYMLGQKPQFLAVASDYATEKAEAGSPQHALLVNQFVKSNIGKMFEKFAGVALAYALHEVDADYAVLPFRAGNVSLIKGKTRSSFRVGFQFGDGSLFTHIDADAFAFCPTDTDAPIYFLSMKSTLKDRFHNVPFWNLLRRAAVSPDFPEIIPADADALARLRYVAICSDFAEEQPDFGTEAGARNLLKVDASLLDGAYVSSSRAGGLPDDCANHLGDVRPHAFYRYSCFFDHLATAP